MRINAGPGQRLVRFVHIVMQDQRHTCYNSVNGSRMTVRIYLFLTFFGLQNELSGPALSSIRVQKTHRA